MDTAEFLKLALASVMTGGGGVLVGSWSAGRKFERFVQSVRVAQSTADAASKSCVDNAAAASAAIATLRADTERDVKEMQNDLEALQMSLVGGLGARVSVAEFEKRFELAKSDVDQRFLGVRNDAAAARMELASQWKERLDEATRRMLDASQSALAHSKDVGTALDGLLKEAGTQWQSINRTLGTIEGMMGIPPRK